LIWLKKTDEKMTVLIGKELWKGGCFKWKRWSGSGSCLVLEGEERDTQE
jgi:hypothetical protein